MSQLLQTDTRYPATAAPPLKPPAGIIPGPAAPANLSATEHASDDDSLFERFAWLYIFFREKIFRDDTQRIVRALWPDGNPAADTQLLELGCGPGFYSCQLAARFPQISVVGVDRSIRQVQCARDKAAQQNLSNCRFKSDNVLQLSHASDTFDALIAARLFTVIPDPEHALSEMHRVLKPGGRCFIAEPRYAIWASLPLLAMWLLAGITGMNNGCREPGTATVLSSTAFQQLFASQPWRKMQTWQDGRYQYALCEKD